MKPREPEGDERSDQRIREDISDRLTDDGDIDPSDVEVNVLHGDVTLTGSVESGQVRRAVEDLVEFVPGVRGIHNELKVVTPTGRVSARVTESPLRNRWRVE